MKTYHVIEELCYEVEADSEEDAIQAVIDDENRDLKLHQVINREAFEVGPRTHLPTTPTGRTHHEHTKHTS